MIRSIIRSALLESSSFTKNGQPISFKRGRAKDDTNGYFFPYTILQVDAYVDGNKAGYLKISYISRENWNTAYPTVIDYVARSHAILRGWQKFSKERLLRELRRSMNQWPFEPTKEELTDEMVMDDAIAHAKAALIDRNENAYNDAEYFLVDKPYVDFIRVDEHQKRKGIGTALYVEGTRWMHELGMLLHASGTQSDDAKRIWDAMKDRFHYRKVPLKFIDPAGSAKKFRYALDPKKLDQRKTVPTR